MKEKWRKARNQEIRVGDIKQALKDCDDNDQAFFSIGKGVIKAAGFDDSLIPIKSVEKAYNNVTIFKVE